MNILKSVSLLAIAQSMVYAPVIGADDADNESMEFEEIVVVGSSIGISRDAAESQSLPIKMFDSGALERSGSMTADSFFRKQPNFKAGFHANNDFDANPNTTLDLRGVGSEYTLTLVNGRRFAVNGPANVGMIPFRALERVEVLNAGASSIYGSDAVAGVVNLVTKKNSDGAEIWGRYGFAPDGYEERDVNFSIGGEGEKFSYFLFGHYGKTDELLLADTEALVSNDNRPLGGADWRAGSTNPARIFFDDGRQLILNTDTISPGGMATSLDDYRPYNHERDAYDRAAIGSTAVSATEQWTIMGSTEYNVSETTTLNFDFLVNEIEEFGRGGTWPVFTTVSADQYWNPFGEDVTISFRPDSPFDLSPFGEPAVDPNAIIGEQENLFLALELNHEINERVSVQLDGSFMRQQTGNFTSRPSRSGVDAALNRPGPEALNPFCYLCNTPEQLNFHIDRVGSTDTGKLYEVGGRVNLSIPFASDKNIDAVFGAGFRKEELSEVPTDSLARGDAAFTPLEGTASSFLSRDVISLYGEVRVPILDGDGGTGALDATVAARYEDYNDVGGTFNPLVSLRWELVPEQVIMRGSWNTSFRAPTLADVGGIPDIDEGDGVDPVTGESLDLIVISGANPNLEPEKARTFSAGFVFRPDALEGFFASVDFWDLKQTNLIIEPSISSILSGTAPGVVREPTEEERQINPEPGVILVERRITNFDSRRIQGLDFNIRQDFDLGADTRLSLDVAGVYLLKFKVDELGSGVSDFVGEFSNDFGGVPKLNAAFGATLQSGAIDARLQFNHKSGYFDAPKPDSGFADIPAWFTVDANLGYSLAESGLGFGDNTTINVGVTNLFNKQAPLVPSKFGFGNVDSENHDIFGRVVYVSIGTKF